MASAAESVGTSALFSLDLSVSSAYELWLSDYFTEEQRLDPVVVAESSDPDGDGLSNLFEYVAGLDPSDRSSRFSVGFENGRTEYLLIGPVVSGVTYDVQYSVDLSVWTSIDSALFETVDEEMRIDLRSLPSSSFYRVVVSNGTTMASSSLSTSSIALK